MQRAWASLLIVLLLVGCRSPSPTATGAAGTNSEDVAALRAEIHQLQRRLDQLEPPSPIQVDAPPIDDQVQAMLAPDHVREVLATGRQLPFGLVAVSDTWQPPQYSPAWHTTAYNRYATVQTIAEAARHRFFILTVFQGSYATAEASLTGVDLADLHSQPCGETPAYPCSAPDANDGSWEVYALKAHVESVRQQGPLVVFRVQPRLEGLEIIWLDKTVLGPALGDLQSVWAVVKNADRSNNDICHVRQVRGINREGREGKI